ncbi:CHAT domain-containing protein, partial [Prochlorococcus marinus]
DESSSDESSSDESSSDESSSDESSEEESSETESSDEESSDEESSDEESSDKESSSSEKADEKDSKPSKASGDRNKKDKESRNKIINQENRIAFAKVPKTEVLSNLNKSMSINRTNTIDVLNLDKSLNSGTNPADIQRQLKIAKSKKRNATSLTRLFYKEKLFASNSQSIKSNESKIFFEKNSYNPAVMHLRFTKAAGKTITENTDSFLDITLIPSEGEVIGKRVELSMKEFGKNLGLLYSQLSRQENLNVELESSPSRVLNNMIFESIKSDLEKLKVTTLLISADRGLQAIPYAALHDGENYFGDSYAFSITPSLGLTDISISDSEDKMLLAIGASEFRELAPLPLVGQELSKIGGTKNKEIIFNKEFTPESFFEKAIQEKYDTIHIATHAEFKPGGPNASRLFSGTTPITLDNFSILRKGRIGNPLDLVVFSACRTALGDPETELGFSGLALQAGAKSAIGTLWYVDDVMTSAYFVQMYKFLDLGIPKAEAMQLTRRLFAQKLITLEDDKLIGFNNLPLLENLNLSQKRLIKNGLNNPFFWAGIELMGSPW